MRTDQILSHQPKVLSDEQRKFYFDNGYLVLNDFVDQAWLDRIWNVTNGFIEASRSVLKSDDKFDLEPGHSPQAPRLRRLSYPTAQHDLYWAFASQGPIVDVAEDLLGPDVVFHHSKLNFKWSGGGEEVKWHQDYPFYPHTSYSVLAIGLYLSDVDSEMGPMGAIPGSQHGPVFCHYDDQDEWSGALRDADAQSLAAQDAGWMTGKAGTITIHNCRTVHGSMPNLSSRMRPLLINAYASADAIPLTVYPGSACAHNCTLVRGERVRQIEFEANSPLLPPDWSGGYTSIFALQQDAALADAPA